MTVTLRCSPGAKGRRCGGRATAPAVLQHGVGQGAPSALQAEGPSLALGSLSSEREVQEPSHFRQGPKGEKMCFVELTLAASRQHPNFGVKIFAELMAIWKSLFWVENFSGPVCLRACPKCLCQGWEVPGKGRLHGLLGNWELVTSFSNRVWPCVSKAKMFICLDPVIQLLIFP